MSENTFDDFNFDDAPLPAMTSDSTSDPTSDPTSEQKPEQKHDLEDEDLKPIKGLDLLDNVSIDIPTLAQTKVKENQEEFVSKKQKDILSHMISDDTEEQVEIQRLMRDRRALSDRLQKDPEFDKRYKHAEREYFDRVNGTESTPDTSVPNDELYKQAQALVERLHNKTGKPEESPLSDSVQDPNDPHGLSRFGEVLHDIPEDSDSDSESDKLLEKPKKKKQQSSSKPVQKIVIKNAKTINIYYNK
jgi:hypothetical protein